MPNKITALLMFKDGNIWRKSSRAAKYYMTPPDYEADKVQSDVGVVFLETAFTAAQAPVLARLPGSTVDYKEFLGSGPFDVAGYGLVDDIAPRRKPSSTLKYINNIDGKDIESIHLGGAFVDIRDTLTLSDAIGYPCQGDSGGPLLAADHNGKPVVFGVFSGTHPKFDSDDKQKEYLAEPDRSLFRKKYPRFHECTGSVANFTDVIENREWINGVIEEMKARSQKKGAAKPERASVSGATSARTSEGEDDGYSAAPGKNNWRKKFLDEALHRK